VTWLREQRDDELFLSVVSVGEIERGIAKAPDEAFAAELAQWLAALIRSYGDRVLPVNADIARRWGRLSAELGHDGADLLIAATALSHRLAVATRNVAHFRPAGVTIVNPFA
jgi:predicted nucleic acid-binding protein